MAKYDSQLTEVKNKLGNSKNILIVLPKGANLDRIASGAALFLGLQSTGKEAAIVCEDPIRVSQANIYGAGSIKNTIPEISGGNVSSGDFTVVLEGVASADGNVPALEKLDWYSENGNLNLVFHVLAGQTFDPKRVYPRRSQPSGGSFDLVFVMGASDLNSLGNIYTQNQQAFSNTLLVNIDNQENNGNFGQANIVDSSASSVSEIMTEVIPSLGLPFDRDIATNLLAGIFEATEAMTNAKVGADTYMAVANCVRVGGQKPIGGQPESIMSQPNQAATPVSQNQAQASQQISNQPPQNQQATNSGLDFSAFSKPSQNEKQNEKNEDKAEKVLPEEVETLSEPIEPQEAGQAVVDQPQTTAASSVQPSPEEQPVGERVVTDSPEPGWLTPKVFKGSSVG